MKLVLTGATGFVGGQLACRLVEEGHELLVVVRSESDLTALDKIGSKISLSYYDGTFGSLYNSLESFEPEVVVHVASLFLSQHSAEDVSRLVQSNILFPTQLLEAMNQLGIKKIVNTGTSWQHYLNQNYNPVNLYAATKQAFESLLTYYVEASEFKAITLKLFDTYGPNDQRPKLIQLLARAAKSGVALDMSGGEQLIDLVHIEDVIAAYIVAINRLFNEEGERQEVFGVSSGHPLCLREVVDILAESMDETIRVNWGTREYRYREVFTPWKEFKSIPGWNRKVSIRDGFKELCKTM